MRQCIYMFLMDKHLNFETIGLSGLVCHEIFPEVPSLMERRTITAMAARPGPRPAGVSCTARDTELKYFT